MQNPNEKWQVEVKGEIYDSTFGELTVWISENSLLESDRVRRGNLRWLDAGRVPPLKPFFEARANGTDPPAVQFNTTDAASTEDSVPTAENLINPAFEPGSDDPGVEMNPVPDMDSGVDQSICNLHPETVSEYLCLACDHAFCSSCPEGFGTSVRTCPYCGGMCRLIQDTAAEDELENRIQRDIKEGFGFGDFVSALGYPFKFKSSLLFGGILVGILGYGQSAAGIQSLFFIAAALICFILSTAFIFGMISNTVDRFAKGQIDQNFIPSFEDFSAWDDVIHPFFLFMGSWLVSFGVMIVLILGLAWFTIGSFTDQTDLNTAGLPGLDKTSTQSIDHVAIVRKKLQAQNQGRQGITVGDDGLTDGQRNTLTEEAEFQKLSDFANNYQRESLESVVGPSPEQQQQEMKAAVTKLVQGAGVFLVLILIAFCWGLFYFPAACAVAGYTKSFWASVNPLIGLDTIRHIGFDYFKILIMSLILWVSSAVITSVIGALLSPFDMPAVGNLPANFLGSLVGFYFVVVFAVTLGFALYKNSDKLKLSR